MPSAYHLPITLPTTIQNDLKALPRWARVAFAARCARRVEPLLRWSWPDMPPRLASGVRGAVHCAEDSAACARRGSYAKDHALEADCAAERASAEPETSDSYYAAHAAANAAGTVVYTDEDHVGAFWAAFDAAAALRTLLGQEPGPILADLQRLVASAEAGSWTDRTPVAPDFFPPLPDIHEAMRALDAQAKHEAYADWERAGRPELPVQQQRDMYFAALQRTRRG